MFDQHEVKRAAAETVLEQMLSGVSIVEVSSGRIIFVNRAAQEMWERFADRSMPTELGDLRDREASNLQVLHPDGRAYEMEEWPVVRSIRSGEEVSGEEIVHLLADGSRYTLRFDSSPIYDEGRIVAVVLLSHDVTEQKRIEEELEKSHKRTEDILDSVTDAFITLDREWRFTYINELALGRIQRTKDEGLTREDLLGKNFWEEFPEGVGTEIYDKYHEALRERKTVEYETYFPPNDRWHEVYIYPSEEGLSVYYQDITERKQAEEQLTQQARLMENIQDAVVVTDDHFVVTAWNSGAEEISGFTAEEVLGRNAFEAIPLGLAEEQRAEIRRELTETGRWRDEVMAYHRDGTPFYVDSLTIALRGEDGRTTGYLSINRDVTERKRAEEEIQTRTYQQAAVAELGVRALVGDDLQALMDEAVTLVARTLGVEYTKIVELLPGGEELLVRAGVGWREGLVGNATEEAGLDSQAGYTLHSEGLVVVEDLSAETRFRPAALLEEHGVVSGMSVVIPGRDGPFGVLGAHTQSRRSFSEDDVNFLQALANVLAMRIQREEVHDRLREVREAERSRITRDLHDEALQGLNYALVEARHVQSISKDSGLAYRLKRLVAVLDLLGSQLRSAIYDLGLEAEQDKPFSGLLESLVELHRQMAPQDLDMRLNLRDGVLLEGALGETGRELLRIIGEALTNTRRHSGARNVLVSVWISEDEDKLYAEISDDGRGIDPAQETQSATALTGGMGTKSMRERARALGADLKIRSEPGVGTKVRFELSLGKEREEPEEEVRLLLVEDHVAIREAIASAFEREAGFTVAGQASSLAEARRVLAAEPQVDVVVVDLGLPDSYGGDLIKELREANPQAQALVLSANLDRAEMARAVEAGAAGILHKTVHLEEVVEAVWRLRAGETLLPLEEVVGLLRFAGSGREEEYEARQAIASLTRREREVLEALAEGLDSRGIADRLHISLRTERNHMASILAKLGVHSQLQALVFALRHGVVEIR